MQKVVQVIKASGEREPFDESKLRGSLLRCGAKEDEIERVLRNVGERLEDGMTTDHIYRYAFAELKKIQNPTLLQKYSLRRALIDLGPTGFPFEKFIAEIFGRRGFEVALDQTVMGACVPHEMDVVAWNAEKLIMAESKFHNKTGEKSDLKVVLYVKARFDDLSERTFRYGKDRYLDEGWLITNTKFSSNAIKYGECAKLRMIGWNYPKKGNLEHMIEAAGLHPVTCLSSLSNEEKNLLLDRGMVTCRQIKEDISNLQTAGFGDKRVKELVSEAEATCKPFLIN